MINLKGTERILRRVEVQRLEKERNDLVTEHIELMDVLREMTEEIKDLEAEIDILTFTIEETETTKDFRNLEKVEKS